MDFYGEAKVVRRVLSWYKHCDRAQRGWLDGRNGRTETRSTSPLRPAHRADTKTASRDLRSGEGLILVLLARRGSGGRNRPLAIVFAVALAPKYRKSRPSNH